MKKLLFFIAIILLFNQNCYAKDLNKHLDYWQIQEQERKTAEEKKKKQIEEDEKKEIEKRNLYLQENAQYPNQTGTIDSFQPPVSTPEVKTEEEKREYVPIGNREKDIYTFSSQDGNIFHLVVEPGEKPEDDHVALLAQVREQDLISLAIDNRTSDGNALVDPLANLTNEERQNYEDKIQTLENQVEDLKQSENEKNGKDDEVKEQDLSPEIQEKPEKKGNNNIIFFVVFVLFIAISVYVKIIRPKKNGNEQFNTDDLDDDDEEYEDDYITINEDEEEAEYND